MILILVVIAGLAAFFLVSTAVPWTRAMLTDHDIAPDLPVAFGCETAWLAIRADDPEEVVDALGLENVQRVNWRTGIGSIYDEELSPDYVFVSPAVGGRIYVVGMALPHPVGTRFVDRCGQLLEDLARRFGEVQYYFTYTLIELYAWARYGDGELQRAFAWGDEGVIWNRGAITPEERQLGLKVLELRRLKASGAPRRKREPGTGEAGYPCESHVIAMAAAWGQDPTELEDVRTLPGLGHIGLAPADWRAHRLPRQPRPAKTTTKTAAERRAELRPVE
ncbi:MAG: hypothetical protein GC150_07800 [Rhizobiales bacterium]|nr:hypothetical protein [Hyphomicrobiales bacterium]